MFLSRTAQRVPYMSSLHLLRILGVMLMTVSWFLCAWTVGVLQNRDRNIPVFVTATTSDGQGFNLCYLDRWDYMMAVGEYLQLKTASKGPQKRSDNNFTRGKKNTQLDHIKPRPTSSSVYFVLPSRASVPVLGQLPVDRR